MKPLSLLFLILWTAIPVTGQNRLGLEGGMNISTLIGKNIKYDNARNLYLVGFNAGPVAEFGLGKHLSLKTAWVLETKGSRGIVHSDTLVAHLGTRLLYLDWPVLVKGNIKTGVVSLYLEAGPYAGMGLTGKGTIDAGDRRVHRDIKWGNDVSDDFKRLDFGGMAGGGIEWKRLYIEGTFMLGLANIFAIRESDYIIQHRVFNIRIGYFLKSKKS